ncbi:hypothetical protein VOLCADRAFT_90955 [Volvox carteri f. nagariensis]|uniref:SAC3/GANP/THP3 conserved domain-containing protein n=1 Tax=Volvox carteri f. nagariensis TaxID=3068 RepID=D8TVT9_VOLCA|nr:uncharacterized protein VOLCADRAFT_90955 [Volvox carteri f. nagariensis]EFJ48360.1 hypothetical protein VOLCADRAFT_90955 [Volvox carteri f. nagariensis]|eukprot:XP_002950614.1 hypothetical protein VOLCADRAFT_90955 [Volvox carteri f. nagariensis]
MRADFVALVLLLLRVMVATSTVFGVCIRDKDRQGLLAAVVVVSGPLPAAGSAGVLLKAALLARFSSERLSRQLARDLRQHQLLEVEEEVVAVSEADGEVVVAAVSEAEEVNAKHVAQQLQEASASACTLRPYGRADSAAGGGPQQQQQQQRGAVGGPGRRVFARLGLSALRESAALDGGGSGSGGGGVPGAAGGRGRGGGSAGGRQGHGGSGFGRGGGADAAGGGGGGGHWRGGRGGSRGGGRNQWVRQQQQQQGGRKAGWVSGPGGPPGGGGGGGDEGMDQVYGDDGGDDDGAPMEEDGGDFDGGDDEEVYDGVDGDAGEATAAAPALQLQKPSGWHAAGRSAQPQPGFAAAAGRTARVPVPVPTFGEKRDADVIAAAAAAAATRADAGGGGGDAATDDEDAALLRKRQQRFGQAFTDEPAAAAGGSKPGTTAFGVVAGRGEGAAGGGGGGGDRTLAGRGVSRSPARWRAGEEEAAGARGSPSPSPPPSPLLSYLGGGGGGDVMGDDDEGGSSGGPALVGTCELMCPVAERKRREATGELNIFERLDPLNSKLTSENLIIKKARKNYSEEDRRPENLRTFRALSLTMARLRSLISNPDETALAASIHCTPEQTLLNVQAFLWDRYREVRKEIIAQHFHARAELLPHVLAWNEEIARFLIISSHELWGNRDFAAQLNQEQLKKVLTDLVTRFYTSASRLGVPTPNAAEMKCYLLILMMGGTIEKNGRRFRQPAEAQMYLRQYSEEELSSPWTTVLFAMMAALQMGNVVAFFDLLARAPYTFACICASHVMPMRSLAMHMLAAAMGAPHPGQPGGRPDPAAAMPLVDLARVLKLSEANATGYAETRQALVQPGGAHGQRDVSFLTSQITAREPKVKVRAQHWITAKRSPVGRHQDTVNPAQLSPELLRYCRQLLTGPQSSGAPVAALHRPVGPPAVLAVGSLGGPAAAAATAAPAATPPRQPPPMAAVVQPPTPASPAPWELGSPDASARVGSGSRPSSMSAAASGLLGSAATSPTSGSGAREAARLGAVATPAAAPPPSATAQQVFGSPARAPAAVAAVGAIGATAATAGMRPAPAVPLAAADAAAAASLNVGSGITAVPPLHHPPPAQQQQFFQYQQQQLLLEAQRAAEAELAMERLKHQADQAIRQEHERHRALAVQCQQLAAAASAAQAALLEAQRREAAFAEQVAALKLGQQGNAIEERWSNLSMRRYLARWQEAARARKRREELLRQQLARASVTFMAAGRRRSALGLLGFGGGGGGGGGGGMSDDVRVRGVDRAVVKGPAATATTTSHLVRVRGRKRRLDSAAPSRGPVGLQQLLMPPDLASSTAAAAAAAAAKSPILTSHLNLAEVVVPGLCRTLARRLMTNGGTATAEINSVNGLNGNGFYGSSRGTAGGREGPMGGKGPLRRGAASCEGPARPHHVFWKLLLLSGALETEASCVSAYQLEAASWLRSRLSCGRTAGPRPLRQPPAGEQLTMEAARATLGGKAYTLTLSTEAATAVAATSGVLMLVDGREFEAALAAGAPHEDAAAEAGQDLDDSPLPSVHSLAHLHVLPCTAVSWRLLLCLAHYVTASCDISHPVYLPTPPPGLLQLPVVILTLASAAATDAIGSHLAATAAATWPPAVAARAPDVVLRQALSYMAESAPVYEQVVSVDLEDLARGAVADVVAELDGGRVGGGVGGDGSPVSAVTAADTIAAFNQLVAAYEAAVQATATSASARWGLPAPEQLLAHVATWSATLTPPRQAMLLASLAPTPGRQLLLLPAAPAAPAAPQSTLALPPAYGLPAPLSLMSTPVGNGGTVAASITPGGTVSPSPAYQHRYAMLLADAMATPQAGSLAAGWASVGAWLSNGGAASVASAFPSPYCRRDGEGTSSAVESAMSGEGLAAASKRQAVEALQRKAPAVREVCVARLATLRCMLITAISLSLF